jgi:RNA polymerase sigma-70 factor (family 1)
MYKSEGNLWEDLRSGNEKAFEYLFDQYWSSLFRYAYSILEDENEAEDLVQELFLDIWEKREVQLPIRTEWKVFLFSCLKKKILKTFRSQGIRKKHLEQLVHQIEKSDLPLKDLLHKELLELIHAQTLVLPEKERQVFLLHELEGYTAKEISLLNKVSEQTVRNQIASARHKILPQITKVLTTCYYSTPIAKFLLIRFFE